MSSSLRFGLTTRAAIAAARTAPLNLPLSSYLASTSRFHSFFQTRNAQTTTESRWQRLKRLRKAAPTPPSRTKHQFDRSQCYDIQQALTHVRAAQWAEFDESLELILRLNIDPRQADQNLRGSIPLPHGTGRKDRVVVFADQDQEQAAIDAGADLVGSDDLIANIKTEKGKPIKGFAAAVSLPHLLPLVASQIGRILGPKGIMPTDKTGTVVSAVSEVVTQIKRGWLTYRTDKDGNVHMNVGRLSFDDAHLTDNIAAAVRGILDVRPVTVKKRYLLKAYMCSSMGPSIQLDLESLGKNAYSISSNK